MDRPLSCSAGLEWPSVPARSIKAGFGVALCCPHLILGGQHLWKCVFETVLPWVCGCSAGLGRRCGFQRAQAFPALVLSALAVVRAHLNPLLGC